MQPFGHGIITARGRQTVSIHETGDMPEFVIVRGTHRIVIISAEGRIVRHLLDASAGKIGIVDGRPGVRISNGRDFVAVIVGVAGGVIIVVDIQMARGRDQSPTGVVTVCLTALAVGDFVQQSFVDVIAIIVYRK